MTNPSSTTQNQTKTETKAEPLNPFLNVASFDPMHMFAASQQQVAKLMTDAHGRAQSFAEQCAQLEAQMVTRAQQAVAGMAQMAQEAIAYGAQLSAEARKLTLAKWTEATQPPPTA